jgi:2-hydroxyglutaryl-CoA dehydratase, D-component
MGGDRASAAALRAACVRPAETAAAWRAQGGKVVGLLGWSAPRELVTAAGLLPVRLSPDRLAGLGHGPESGASARPDAAAGFGRELAPATAGFAAALLAGALGWIDYLLIGRDREDYTRLFYLLRELRRSGAAPDLIPVAFFDLLRLPSRTSARYNRQRAAKLLAVIAGWAGRPVTPADLAGAVVTAEGTAHSFCGIQKLRTRPRPGITGTDALAAAIAARVLPAGELRPLLDAVLSAGLPGAAAHEPAVREAALAGAADAPGLAAPAARIFLAGSATDDLTAYEALEDLGLAVVGEDHEWGDDGSEYPRATRDPLDGIVDRYQFAHGGAARAGLRDRVERTAGRVRSAAADGVLYLLGAHDEAAGWELPALRERLGGGIPLVPVRLGDRLQSDRAQGHPVPGDAGPAGDGGRPELREAGRRLLAELGAAGTVPVAQRARPAAGGAAPAAGHAGAASWTAEAGRG